MSRSNILIPAVGFVAALALGCGPTEPPVASGEGKDQTAKQGDSPQPFAKGKPADGVFRTSAELIADLPRDAYPAFGPMGHVERQDAEKWLKANVVGRPVEWTPTAAVVSATGSGPYEVTLEFEKRSVVTLVNAAGSSHGPWWLAFSEPVTLGDQMCQLVVRGKSPHGGAMFTYPACTRAEFETLRKASNKKVALRATVKDVKVLDDGYRVGTTKHVVVQLEVALPSVDGFLPEAGKAKENK